MPRLCRSVVARAPMMAVLPLLVALAAPLAAVEALTVRVSDAIGAPGSVTAITLRTYATRPVRRGRASARAGSAFSRGTLAGAGSPFAQFLSGEIYSADGDVIGTFDFDDATQTIVADFESDSATINAEDGILGVMFVQLDSGLTPGSTFEISLDPAGSFLNDPDDDAVQLEHRAGELKIRAAADPLTLEVDGGKVHPGSAADIEISTAEPFAIESGRIVVHYDPAIASALPSATSDARHGVANLTVSHPASGILQIDIASPAGDFNTVPGGVLRVTLPTLASNVIGSTSALTVDLGESYLDGPGGVPLDLFWETDPIEFVSDPGIFRDDFETGDAWVWSRLVSP